MNGYLYVATVRYEYYLAAKESALSLLDFHPEANICLFTLPEWVEEEDHEIFDRIVTDIPNHTRTKLWALSRTPYDLTLYVDCDTWVQSEDIQTIFNYIEDNDIIFTRNRPYNSKITQLNEEEEMIYHCGIFLYRKNMQIVELMDDWYEYYCKQINRDHDMSPYPEKARPWDTFTMWYLLNKTKHKDTIKIGDFPSPDARWNFCMGQRPEELEGQDVIITHYSLGNVTLNEKHTNKSRAAQVS
jgi:hypothetical protein